MYAGTGFGPLLVAPPLPPGFQQAGISANRLEIGGMIREGREGVLRVLQTPNACRGSCGESVTNGIIAPV